ncbi:transposase [Cupriavidus sp. RAF20_2]|uniref:transposase n=1 Tax=Cupriavidus sp. RAF20_2 TaxID=3233053 RepID=UPI003F8E8D5A
MDKVSTVARPRRREYSAEFKTTVLEQIRQEGASVAGVALSHGLNPNMVHRWMREGRQRQLLAALQSGSAFVPLHIKSSPAVGHPSALLPGAVHLAHGSWRQTVAGPTMPARQSAADGRPGRVW